MYCISHYRPVCTVLVTIGPYVLYWSSQGRMYSIDHQRAICAVLLTTGPYVL